MYLSFRKADETVSLLRNVVVVVYDDVAVVSLEKKRVNKNFTIIEVTFMNVRCVTLYFLHFGFFFFLHSGFFITNDI